MKYALIIPDGAADERQESLGGKTPLEAARIPEMNAVARSGVVGRSNNVPDSLPSGSDVGTMSLFGYDPKVYHTGRAPLEAAAQGISLAEDDWAIRCNLVTIRDGRMESFTAGQVPSTLGKVLVEQMQRAMCGDEHWKFYPGVSYRNLLLYRGRGKRGPFAEDTHTVPPHDITGQEVAEYLPMGSGACDLRSLMEKSVKVFAECAENRQRQTAGELAATQIWLWGQGKAPALELFEKRYKVRGAVITAVDLLRGIARLLGWEVIEVPGATGYLDTDYGAKGRYAVEALKRTDFIVVHVEATDEASHEGDAQAKVEALERIDREIVGPVHAALKKHGEYRILISPDHPTFLRTKTHSHGYVPFAICGSGVRPMKVRGYDEFAAAEGELFDEGHRLMERFLHG